MNPNPNPKPPSPKRRSPAGSLGAAACAAACAAAFLQGAGTGAEAAPMPIDPLWKSPAFRRAFTGSYGIDARIEPLLTAKEKSVLESVAGEMAAGDREGAAAALTGSGLLAESPALLFSLGNIRFEQGRNSDAIENFRLAIERFPGFRDAHRNLAVALVQSGDPEGSEPHLTRAVELGATDGLVFGLLGYVHGAAGRHQPALQAYRMAQMTMPGERQWVAGEAAALTGLGDGRAAASLFDRLLESEPHDPILWLGQAAAWSRAGEPERSIVCLEFVRRLGALGPGDSVTLGELYLAQSLPALALERYREAVEQNPPVPFELAVRALESLAGALEFDAAAQLAGVAEPAYGDLADEPAGARFQRVLALVELETGDAAVGASRVEELVARDPRDGLSLLLLAKFREAEGRRDEAVMLLEQAVAVSPSKAEALFELGRLLAAGGDYRGAVARLEESLALQPRPGLDAYLESLRGFARGGRAR